MGAEAVLPALSVAVQVRVFDPTDPRLSAVQLCVAMPERLSAAPELEFALPLSVTGLGVTLGFRVGLVASRLMETAAALVESPALLVQEPLNVALAVSAV